MNRKNCKNISTKPNRYQVTAIDYASRRTYIFVTAENVSRCLASSRLRSRALVSEIPSFLQLSLHLHVRHVTRAVTAATCSSSPGCRSRSPPPWLAVARSNKEQHLPLAGEFFGLKRKTRKGAMKGCDSPLTAPTRGSVSCVPIARFFLRFST